MPTRSEPRRGSRPQSQPNKRVDPPGRTISGEGMIRRAELDDVAPDEERAGAAPEEASRHLGSAAAIAERDPIAAHLVEICGGGKDA